MLITRLASGSDCGRWDKLVLSLEDATPYHLYHWREVIESTYGLRAFYILAESTEQAVEGVLPLFEMRTITGGRGACSLPFCNYGGPLAANKEAEDSLLNATLELARSERWQSVQLRCLRPLERFPQADLNNVTQVVHLPRDSAAFTDSLNRKLRWMVRKATQSGLETVFCRDRVRDFYLVYSENMRDLGTPTHPEIFFSRLLDSFPESTGLLMLYDRDKPAGGMFTFHFKDSLCDPWASSVRKYFEKYPNYLLYYEAFRQAISLGAEKFDLGRSQRGTGTFNFKSKWRAEVKQLYYNELIGGRSAAGLEGKMDRLKPVSALYSHLPLSLSRLIGPKLRKYLP